MNKYYECGIRYEKTLDNGMQKKVTEIHLLDALSFTEAEKRIIEEMQTFISGEFEVKTIKQAGYSELILSDETSAYKYFKCKLSFILLYGKSCKEKKTSANMLVQAASTEDATDKLNAALKQTMADYEITSVSETKIMDYFPYKVKEDSHE